MVDEGVLMQQEIMRKQREAEQRVRRMREENRRLVQQMGAVEAEKRVAVAPPSRRDGVQWLPLLLALVILREHGPIELVLALVYLAL